MNRVMKDSGIGWIGEIPKEWDLRRIKTLFSIVAGATPKSGEPTFWNGDIPWITPADFTTEDVYVASGHKEITQEGLDSCATTLIPAESIIFSKRAPVGLVAINRKSLCTNQGCLSCIPKENIATKYYYYAMSVFAEQFNMLATGTTFKEIAAEVFCGFILPYPHIGIQERISSYLDKKCAEIDSLIASKEKINTLLKDWRQSIIYEAVTKGLDPNVPLKNSGIEWIGKIPASWSTAPLRSKFSFGKGLTITKSDLADDGFCVISYGQIHSKDNVGVCVNDSLVKYISKSHKSLVDSAKTNVGDFIFADTSEDIQGCGNNVYIDRDDCIYAGYHTLILRSKNSRQNKYYAYLFSSDAWRAQVRARVSGVKLYSITQGILKSTTLIVPPPSEQDRIIEYLDAKCNKIDLAITQNNVTIQQLKEYRQSLIYEAVTGKICINEMEKK